MIKRCPFCDAEITLSAIYTEAVFHPHNGCVVFSLANLGVSVDEWNVRPQNST